MTPAEQRQNAAIAQAIGLQQSYDFLRSDAAARVMRGSLSKEECKQFAKETYNLITGRKWDEEIYAIELFGCIQAIPRVQSEAYCRVKGIKWEVEG